MRGFQAVTALDPLSLRAVRSLLPLPAATMSYEVEGFLRLRRRRVYVVPPGRRLATTPPFTTADYRCLPACDRRTGLLLSFGLHTLCSVLERRS